MLLHTDFHRIQLAVQALEYTGFPRGAQHGEDFARLGGMLDT